MGLSCLLLKVEAFFGMASRLALDKSIPNCLAFHSC